MDAKFLAFAAVMDDQSHQINHVTPPRGNNMERILVPRGLVWICLLARLHLVALQVSFLSVTTAMREGRERGDQRVSTEQITLQKEEGKTVEEKRRERGERRDRSQKRERE